VFLALRGHRLVDLPRFFLLFSLCSSLLFTPPPFLLGDLESNSPLFGRLSLYLSRRNGFSAVRPFLPFPNTILFAMIAPVSTSSPPDDYPLEPLWFNGRSSRPRLIILFSPLRWGFSFPSSCRLQCVLESPLLLRFGPGPVL